jgi:endonuclease/exonuclease/phosphatase family metal-dependent hydrolase
MRLPRIALSLGFAAVVVSCNGKKDLTDVRVMTYNLAVGIDLDTIFLQPTLLAVEKQAEIAWAQKDESDFAVRAKAVAAQIAAAQPDVVGLQEVAQFFRQFPPDGPPPPYGPGTPAGGTPVKDFLTLLLAELNAGGPVYSVASTPGTADQGIVTNADVEVTGADANGNFTADYRVVDREAVIVRNGFTVTSVRKGNYAAHIDVPIPGLPTPFPYQRGWIVVDGVKGGKAFTFLSTHLDAFDPRVQGAQAHELLAIVSSSTPTLVVGDMNSDPADAAWPAHGILVSSTTGFADSAADVGASAPSCCYDAICKDPNARPTRRVDLVLHSPHFEARSVELRGTAMENGLWPSDHDGVSAVLGLE